MPSVLHIIVLGEWRDHSGAVFDLADATEDDFRAPVVYLQRAADFHGAAGEAADVSYIFEVMAEDHHRERTGHLVFAEIQEVDAFYAYAYLQDFALYAIRFANVLRGFMNGKAVGGPDRRRERCCEQRE